MQAGVTLRLAANGTEVVLAVIAYFRVMEVRFQEKPKIWFVIVRYPSLRLKGERGRRGIFDRINRMEISGVHGPLIPSLADRTVRYLMIFF
jgi:hypothetical protein